VQIDLSRNTCSRSPYPEKDLEAFSCGRGYNVAYLSRHLAPDADPLHPDNILAISCGLLTGTTAPASSRVHLSALSPQTGLLGSSSVGGYFGAALRAAGIQSLVITGRARDPSLLWIHENKVEILGARDLWGLDTWMTEEGIREKFAPSKITSLAIGPAGEHVTAFACVVGDREHAAGRTGMGAVMGSKLLKAIVVQRPTRFPASRSSRERAVIDRYVRLTRKSREFEPLSKYGGAGYMKWADDMGILATRNYRSNHFEGADRIDSRNLAPYKRRSTGCYRCPVQCKAELYFHEGMHRGMRGVRPEFESTAALGARCGLDNIQDIVFLDNLCTRLGIDTISAAGAIAFVMDLFERGILSQKDVEGLDLHWGNAKAMETLITQMAQREGFGNILSQGLRKAAEIIGRNAIRYAPQVKGLDLSAYHPSHIMGTALSYAISSRGGDFNQVYPSIEYAWSPEEAVGKLGDPGAVDITSTQGKSAIVKRAMLVNIALDCLGLCKVPSLSLIRAFDLQIESELVTILTGYETSPDTLFRIAERIAHLERIFNIRHGATTADDRLPEMFLERNRPESIQTPRNPDWLRPMVRDFYRVMGWDEKGVPKQETLHTLAIEEFS
jgi:aldehyde:ferredoxin oxidoreductase